MRSDRVFRPYGGFEVIETAFAPPFATKTAFLLSAESDRGIQLVGSVDPNHAGLQMGGDLKRLIDGLAPDAGRQSIARMIGQLDRFIMGTKTHCDDDWTENFLTCDLSGGLNAADQGRWIEETFRGKLNAGLIRYCARLNALGNHVSNSRQLARRNDRAHIDRLVQGMPDTQAVHPCPQTLKETFGDAFLHQNARPGAANLSLVKPDRIHDTLHGGIEVGIIEHDKRRLAPEFECQGFTAAGGQFANLPPDGGGPGKSDLINIVMRGQK